MRRQPRILRERYLQGLALALFITLLTSVPALAQQATGKIVGTITDPHGAVMPGVTVTATNIGTDIKNSTVTDKDGFFQILNLPIGNYRLTAERDNFRKLVTNTPPLQINQVLRMDLRMEVGARSETVTVEANAVAVETVNATLGQVVTERAVQDMPLNGRNVLDLALLQPGVTEVNPGATENAQAGSYGIAGGKSDSVTFLLDGGINNDLLANGVVYNPNPDTVAEFRILTSNYSAEYGRNAGGVVSVVTKSGTNTLHGSAYDFLRNDALDANSYFNKKNDLPRNVLKRNQFGGTLGGPIYIPSVVDGKDKYFWFASYTGQRQTQIISTTQLPVYTTDELNGDFSHSGPGGTPDLAVAAFLTANPYWQPNPVDAANAKILPARISPVAKNYIAANLIPTSPTGLKIATGTSTDNSDQFTTKLDLQLSPNNKLSATLGLGRHPVLNPFSFSFGAVAADAFGYGSTGDHHQKFANFTWTHTFSNALLNEARFTAQRNNVAQAIPAKQLPTASDLVGVGITPDESTGPPMIEFNKGLTLGFPPQGPTSLINNTFSLSDTLSWIKGKHTMKFGFYWATFQNNTHYDFYVNGDFIFYGSAGSSFSGNDFADFLFGLPDEYVQFGAAPSNIRSKSYALFAQDEWHIKKNFVLTYGLRWEFNSPKLDTQGRSFTVLPGQQSQRFVNAPPGLLFPGDPAAPRGANFPDHNDFAPRLGFAWDPFNNGKTSIRGGIGVFYDILKGEDNLQFNGQGPFFGYSDLFFPALAGNPAADPGYMQQPYVVTGQPNPFPSKPPAPNIDFGAAGFIPFGGGGVYFVNPHLRTPYTYQYNLSVQHELATGLTLEASYVGSSTHKQTALADQNPFVLGTTSRVLNPVVDNFSYLLTFYNLVGASYNSLETSLTKRFTGNEWFGKSYFTLAYTWGKSIDNASGFRNINSQVPFYNPGLFRSVSDYDVTHRIVFSGGWDLPFDKAWASGPKRLVKGWSIYPIVTWRSGFPMDIFAGLRNGGGASGPSGAGDQAIVRANLTSTTVGIYDPRQAQTFNIQVFDPATCTFVPTPTSGNFYFDPTVFNNEPFADPGPPCFPAYDPVANPYDRSYGSYPRNYLRGPSRGNFDFAISKKTPLAGERLNLEFRAEFFNLLNQAQFQMPTLNISDPNFGQVTSTYEPRIIQFGLRLSF